jgi:hypothetical protein
VTIHVGSNPLRDAPPGATDNAMLDRLSIGAWDFRACSLLQEHISKLGDVHVRFEEHVAGTVPEIDFYETNHIFLGSTQVNQAVEDAVCWAFGGLPTVTPRSDGKIPYSFVWSTNGRRPRPSSLGWTTDGDEIGIAESATRKLVARYVFAQHGEGHDCAMIMAHRIRPLRKQDRIDEDDERLLIAILGYSGPGTYAGASAAVHEETSRLLYPPECNKPMVRVVQALTHRPGTDDGRDDRKVSTWALL